MTNWIITPLPDGRYEVRARGRGTKILDDEESAVRHACSRMKPGDKVRKAEKDGYLVPVTRRPK